MSELRHDPTTDGWVIVAPERNRRPRNGRPPPGRMQGLPSFDPTCPFCPGNESLLPSIIAETGSSGEPGWGTRVVANKFAAVSQDAADRNGSSLYEIKPGWGHHEVIVEASRHDKDLVTMSKQEIHAVLLTYRNRYDALMVDAAVQSVILFRNRGSAAGASIQHPHSQMVALQLVPPLVEARQAAMIDYYKGKSRCVLCDVIAHEQMDGSRIVAENDAFVSVAPFAAIAPCEMWLLPKRHQADFGEIQDAEIGLLAVALQDALIRLSATLRDPPYNYVIDSAAKGGSGAPHLHWRLRIVPQVVTPAGFELGSGLPINTSAPEHDAAVLRSAAADCAKEMDA